MKMCYSDFYIVRARFVCARKDIMLSNYFYIFQKMKIISRVYLIYKKTILNYEFFMSLKYVFTRHEFL